MTLKNSARVSAKLILSGEHSVVYGAPAIAMAVDRHMTAVAEFSKDSVIQVILNQFPRLYSLAKLKEMVNEVENSGLNDEIDFADYAFAAIYLKLRLQTGLRLIVTSEIPIGCGMGSSAALLLALWGSLSASTVLSEDDIEFLRQIESYQHGCSSGLDIKVCAQGGCLFLEKGVSHSLKLPTFPILLINTGEPHSNTAACGRQAQAYLEGTELLADFSAVTLQMRDALVMEDYALFCKSVTQNQRYLEQIGVVPRAVASLIHDLESRGYAAKICGAGSVLGDAAGVIIVVGSDLDRLLGKFPEKSAFIHGVSRGLDVWV